MCIKLCNNFLSSSFSHIKSENIKELLRQGNLPFLGISSDARGVNVIPLVPPLRAIHLSSPKTSYVRGLTNCVGSGAGIAV